MPDAQLLQWGISVPVVEAGDKKREIEIFFFPVYYPLREEMLGMSEGYFLATIDVHDVFWLSEGSLLLLKISLIVQKQHALED